MQILRNRLFHPSDRLVYRLPVFLMRLVCCGRSVLVCSALKKRQASRVAKAAMLQSPGLATFQICEDSSSSPSMPRGEAWQPLGAMATRVLQTGQGWDSSSACRPRLAADHSGEENALDALDVDQSGSMALLRAPPARPPNATEQAPPPCSAAQQKELGATAQAQLKWLAENTDVLPRETAEALPGVGAPCSVHNSEKESGVTANHRLALKERGGNVRGSDRKITIKAISSNTPNATAASPGAERNCDGSAPSRQLMWDPAWAKESPEPVREGRVKSRTPVDLGIEVVHQRLEAATSAQ